MAAMAPHPVLLDNTMGAQLIGVILAASLYGVSCLQAFYYLTWYPEDRWQLRYLVIACWAFDTVHQALISHTIYIYVIKNWGNEAILGQLVWSLVVEVLFNALVTILVQTFYVFRIWRLSEKNWVLTAPVVALVLAEFGAGLSYTAQALRMTTFAELATLKALSITVNVLAAAGDVLIAFLLCVMLYTSRTGFKKSDTMIRKLIIFVVNTGLLTSTCALGSLVSILAWPNAFIYICFYFTLGRLYTNSLLATLNARRGIWAKATGADTGFSLPTLSRSVGSVGTNATRSPVSPKSGNHSMGVRVEMTKEWKSDDEDLDMVFRIPSPGDEEACIGVSSKSTCMEEARCDSSELDYDGASVSTPTEIRTSFRLGTRFDFGEERDIVDTDTPAAAHAQRPTAA